METHSFVITPEQFHSQPFDQEQLAIYLDLLLGAGTYRAPTPTKFEALCGTDRMIH